LDKRKEDRRRRKAYYDGYVKVALVKVWEIFDFACGQRLKSSLEVELFKRLTPRLVTKYIAERELVRLPT